jgi:hypothetical protein
MQNRNSVLLALLLCKAVRFVCILHYGLSCYG